MLRSAALIPKLRLASRSLAPVTYLKPSLIVSSRQFSATTFKMSSISDVIKHDHQELEDFYNRIVNSSDKDEQLRYRNEFTWELARHSLGEEIVVYPELEKIVSGGHDLADKDRAQHQKIKEQLYKFQSMEPTDPEFLPTIKGLFKDLKEHINEEEQEDLPKLEQSLGGEASQSLATSFQRTKKFVPTRSHPSAPDKPPFETAVGLLTAPIDKLRDLFRKFPKDWGIVDT